MSENKMSIGWIGAGRMGIQLATRLLEAGYEVAVYNRTKSKLQPLLDIGRYRCGSSRRFVWQRLSVQHGLRVCGSKAGDVR